MNIFVLVEYILPEGVRIHGIFTTLQGAVDAVPKCDIWNKCDALIAEVPFDTPLTGPDAAPNERLVSQVAAYELDGTKLT